MRRDLTRSFRTRRHTFLAFVAGALMVLGAQAPSWGKPAAPIAAETGRAPSPSGERPAAPAPLFAAPSLDETYAAREAKAKSLETFKGGDVVIIGSTGLVIILLVVLILVIV